MDIIKKGAVISYDIKRILNGNNAFDFKYKYIPDDSVIDIVRNNFENSINKVFNDNVTIITEEEMLLINNLIEGYYPHCYVRQSIC